MFRLLSARRWRRMLRVMSKGRVGRSELSRRNVGVMVRRV